jgi:hypothetical protein
MMTNVKLMQSRFVSLCLKLAGARAKRQDDKMN